MAALPTNYKEDIFQGNRKYQIVENGDGTVSFIDVTEYSQEGDTFGAAQINEINTKVNAHDDSINSHTSSISSLNTSMNTANTNITNLGRQLRSAGASGTNFYFDYKNGKYGWNSSSARGADTFHPFRGDISDADTQIFSQTYDSDKCPSSITFSNLTRIDVVTAINIESTNCRVGISWMGISGNTLNLGYQVTYSGTVTITITCKQYHAFD